MTPRSGSLGEQADSQALPGAAKASLVALALFAVGTLPFARLPGPELPGVTSVFCASLFVTELATAMLLLVRFHAERRPWLVLVVCGYFFSALMAILYLLAFPGALQPGRSLIGEGQTASWLFAAWPLAMPLAAIAACLLEMRRPQLVLEPHLARRVMAGSLALTIGGAALFTALVLRAPVLPALIAEGRWTALFMVIHGLSTSLMLLGVAVIAFGPGKRSDLFAWFGVTLMAMAVANLFAAVGGERYSLGWTGARIGYAAGAGVLFGFFLWLFSRQQRLLASARERLEAEVEVRTAELQDMVRERDTLLSEVYHRVNNNLQVLRSMLNHERRNLAAPCESAALARMDRRTLGIGVVHRKAMEARHADAIDVGAVIEELAVRLQDVLAQDGRAIRIEVQAATVWMKLDFAVPLGLLIQELVTSLVQEPAPGTADRTIRITFEESGRVRRLAVQSSHPTRLPDRQSPEALIISGLVGQLGGSEDFADATSPGCVVNF